MAEQRRKRSKKRNRAKKSEEPSEKDLELWKRADYVDQNMARALAHPMRVQILAELNQRMMSPSEFSECFAVPLSNVSYHFRVLHEYECIEVVETQQVRGAVEHFYHAVKRALFDGKAWDDLPESLRAGVSAGIMSDFLCASAAAMESGSYDARKSRMAVWFQRRLDETGWDEAAAAQRKLVDEMAEIYRRAAARLAAAGDPAGGFLGTYGVFLFESPSPQQKTEDA